MRKALKMTDFLLGTVRAQACRAHRTDYTKGTKKMHTLTFIGGAIAVALASGFAHAQDEPAAAPADFLAQAGLATAPESVHKPTTLGAFEVTGYVDVGYTNFSKGSGKFISNTNSRTFDFKDSALIFHNLSLLFAKLPEHGVGAMVDVTIGRDADTIAAYGTIDRNRGPANGVDKKFDVTQAHLHYGAGPFSIIAGKFVTSAGAEVIRSPSNSNYSRSILFGYAIPFTHTGLRATYKANDTLSILGGINQGWDAVKDTNSDKTLELGAIFSPIKPFTLSAMFHNGKERAVNYPDASRAASANGTRTLLDVVATYNATDRLTFIVNYDNASQENAPLASGGMGTAKWEGWAGYVNYAINDQWKVSLRGEWFNDKDGYRTTVQPGATSGQKWKEATLTLAHLPAKNVELRAELRFDRSTQAVFRDEDGAGRSSQNSIGLEAIYKF